MTTPAARHALEAVLPARPLPRAALDLAASAAELSNRTSIPRCVHQATGS